MRTSILDLLLLTALLASVPGAASAQFAGGIGRGDVHASFVPAISTGINELPHGTATPLRAWPVPATGTIRLDRPVTATVHDMAGHVVGSVTRAAVVDISGLPPGAYLLRTEQGATLRLMRE